MSDELARWLVSPTGLVVCWVTLHWLDLRLTLAGARLRAQHAKDVIRSGGSYELNPLFQKQVDAGSMYSRRFLVTWLGIAGVMWGCGMLGALLHDPVLDQGLAVLSGVLLFSRVAVISNHLSNIWLFRRMASNPQSVTGGINYSRPTVFGIAAVRYLSFGALVGLAAVLSPSPFLFGGAAGLTLHSLTILFWLARSARSQKPATA